MNDDFDNDKDDMAMLNKLKRVVAVLTEAPKKGEEGLRELCGKDQATRLRYACGSLHSLLEAVCNNLTADQIEGKEPAPETLPVVLTTLKRTLALIEGDVETAVKFHREGSEFAAMHDATKNSKVGVGNA